jgi:hypothetical protein
MSWSCGCFGPRSSLPFTSSNTRCPVLPLSPSHKNGHQPHARIAKRRAGERQGGRDARAHTQTKKQTKTRGVRVEMRKTCDHLHGPGAMHTHNHTARITHVSARRSHALQVHEGVTIGALTPHVRAACNGVGFGFVVRGPRALCPAAMPEIAGDVAAQRARHSEDRRAGNASRLAGGDCSCHGFLDSVETSSVRCASCGGTICGAYDTHAQITTRVPHCTSHGRLVL